MQVKNDFLMDEQKVHVFISFSLCAIIRLVVKPHVQDLSSNKSVGFSFLA